MCRLCTLHFLKTKCLIPLLSTLSCNFAAPPETSNIWPPNAKEKEKEGNKNRSGLKFVASVKKKYIFKNRAFLNSMVKNFTTIFCSKTGKSLLHFLVAFFVLVLLLEKLHWQKEKEEKLMATAIPEEEKKEEEEEAPRFPSFWIIYRPSLSRFFSPQWNWIRWEKGRKWKEEGDYQEAIAWEKKLVCVRKNL